jgi:hydrogenase maturation protease
VTISNRSGEPTPRFLIIGVGNCYRSDDAAGILVARRLSGRLPDNIGIIEHSGEGVDLMNLWENKSSVILIDAVSSESAPGTIHRLDAGALPIPSDFFHYSTHAFSVAEAVEMSRVLNRLPTQFIIYGIEGRNFAAGTRLSEEILKAVEEVADLILKDVILLVGKNNSRA